MNEQKENVSDSSLQENEITTQIKNNDGVDSVEMMPEVSCSGEELFPEPSQNEIGNIQPIVKRPFLAGPSQEFLYCEQRKMQNKYFRNRKRNKAARAARKRNRA